VSEKELGKALLRLDGASLAAVPDARQQTWRVLERDRRRVWWLTVVTVGIWLLAVAHVVSVLVHLNDLGPKQAQLMKHMQEGKITPEVREGVQASHQLAMQKLTMVVTAAVGLLALAALCTVFLVLASRRATLRQVNASLVEISEQLKHLRPTPPGPPAPPGVS
jgi:hypothetical protein